MKALIIVAATIAFLAALTACGEDKSNQGLHTGVVLKDCPAIKTNQREDAARTIKGLDKDQATKALAAQFGISEADAAACLG